MGISLRIVGLIYSQDNIPYQAGPSGQMTVQDVLNLAIKNPGKKADKFGYISAGEPLVAGSRKSVSAFFVRFTEEHTSPVSGAVYPKGEYFLSESNVGNPRYTVWQYYITDKTGQRRKLKHPTESFATQTVEDGDSVVWRLVEILSGVNPVPTVYRTLLGLS